MSSVRNSQEGQEKPDSISRHRTGFHKPPSGRSIDASPGLLMATASLSLVTTPRTDMHRRVGGLAAAHSDLRKGLLTTKRNSSSATTATTATSVSSHSTPKSAPVYKLTVDLIRVYKRINEVEETRY